MFINDDNNNNNNTHNNNNKLNSNNNNNNNDINDWESCNIAVRRVSTSATASFKPVRESDIRTVHVSLNSVQTALTPKPRRVL